MSPKSASVSARQQSAAQEVSVKTKYGRPKGDDNQAQLAKIRPDQQLPDDAVNNSIYLYGWV